MLNYSLSSNNDQKPHQLFTRRQFLRTAAAGMGTAIVMSGCGTIQPKPAANRKVSAHKPNVIFILTDDQGWGDLSVAGHPYMRTPHLDRLAQEGTRFTQFYVNATVCAPSRVSFMTGQYPARNNARRRSHEKRRLYDRSYRKMAS